MSTDSLGVAVIGAGMVGRSHLAGYRAATAVTGSDLPPVRLVAVADAAPGLAEEQARRFGYERGESTWQAVAEADDVQVVSVAVANALHREVVEGLLAAGKHVLCEKPMAPTIEDAEAMTKAAQAASTQTALGFTFRRSPAIAAIKQLVDGGNLGRPLHFNGHYWCDYAASAAGPMSWRYKGGPGSGALADIGSHVIDLAEFLCGPVRSVRGATFGTAITERALPLGNAVGHAAAQLSDDYEPVENEDVATFLAEFENGCVGTFSVSRAHFGHANDLGFELFGTEGAATFDLEAMAEFHLADGSAAPGTQGYRRVLAGPAHPYLTGGLPMDFPGVGYGQNDYFVWQARAFLEQCAGIENLPHPASFEEGLRNLRLLAAVTESAAAGGADVTI